MLLTILYIIGGLLIILLGANYLVEGSTVIARKSGLSEFVIGVTIIGIGTSTPEMVVSFLSALKGNSDIAVGNVVGSNIFNILLTLGLTAIIFPIPFTKSNIKRDVPISLFAALMLLILGYDMLFGGEINLLSRIDGVILLALFALYLFYSFRSSGGTQEPAEEGKQERERPVKLWLAIVMILGGLSALIFGGEIFVRYATRLAKMTGVPDAFIAITLMAGGTSLPELASSLVAAAKKKGQMALGNVIGSNISNLFLILGGSALIKPLTFNNITSIDISLLVISSILLFISYFTFKRKILDRMDGLFLVATYIAYIIWWTTRI